MVRLLLAALVVVGLAAVALYQKAEHIVLGAEGYLFGYPLVIMDVTRASSASVIGPENQLNRARQFPDATFKEVVRPNVDTLYTSAFIDTRQGPWVFEMPANTSRYDVMPFMDAWTHVFAAPGTRSTGTAGGRFLLVGPAWQGTVPAGLTLLRSPTAMVWLIGRTQTNGASDYPVVHRLQDALALRTEADWAQGKPEPQPRSKPSRELAAPPVAQVQAMSAQVFFTRLAMLMVDNPASSADGPMLAKLDRIGVKPGQALNWTVMERWGVALGRWIADWKVRQELGRPRERVNGWVTPPMVLGNYGTAYNTRAAVAMVGLGANLPADAMYPSAAVDAQGHELDGRYRYRLHFERDQLPPVHAFWSVTAYGKDDFLIPNPLNRYALGDRDPLKFNADGSLDLWLQADAPDEPKISNWLPVGANTPFLLNARLYWPKPDALEARWHMPAVHRADGQSDH
jgi:hypothetical protein